MLKFGIAAAAIALSLAIGSVAANAATPQQEKMKTCNADAGSKGLKGDERNAFMSNCLSSKPADAEAKAMTPQQEKMKKCNADATGKTGEARKAFMSTCLKG